MLEAKVISIDTEGKGYKRLLGGPPYDSAALKSGSVALEPGANVGQHSTHTNEELIIPLSGEGILQLGDGKQFPIKPGMVLYNPPETVHDVLNTGTEPLCYIYVVVRT